MTEESLPKSRTHDSVVRVGDTVRRPTGAWTPTIHAYLNHLHRAAFSGAPRVLGIDEDGREIVTYSHGHVPHDPEWEPGIAALWPPEMRSLEALDAIGRLLRMLHDASEGFAPADAVWMQHDSLMAPNEIVCHGDVGPWNTVFVDNLPVAFIDWDGARPNLAVLELAGTVWNFAPLGGDPTNRNGGFPTRDELPERVARICRAYGVTDRSLIRWALRETVVRGTQQIRFWPVDAEGAACALEMSARSLHWLAEREDTLLRALP